MDQILKPREGFKGLTNRACNEKDQDGKPKCVVKEYLFEDAEFRETANKLNFLCNVGGRRFKICKDKAGLCRFSHRKECFLGICIEKELQEEFMPASKYQFMLDANTHCASKDVYPLF